MTTSTELFAQAQQLLAQANQMLRQEKSEVITSLRAKIATYGITAKDLGLSSGPSNQAYASRKSVRYRGPDGQEWAGRGRRPQWLKAALDAGADVEQFRIH